MRGYASSSLSNHTASIKYIDLTQLRVIVMQNKNVCWQVVKTTSRQDFQKQLIDYMSENNGRASETAKKTGKICHICGKEVSTSSNLKRHSLRTHSAAWLAFECNYCHKVYHSIIVNNVVCCKGCQYYFSISIGVLKIRTRQREEKSQEATRDL